MHPAPPELVDVRPRAVPPPPDPLAALREAAAGLLPLSPLAPAVYARAHASFEARSDQRALLSAWLAGRVAARSGGPTRVLSVGAGDGAVDAVVARVLVGSGCPVRYEAVEPHPGSVRRWAAAMRPVPGVRARVQQATFEDAALPDEGGLRRRAVRALALLRAGPGGRPRASARAARARGRAARPPRAREGLNELVTLLAPHSGGHPQWFAEQVAAALAAQGLPAVRERLSSRLDLAPGADPEADAQVLDFTVQAVLPPQLRPLVLRQLALGRLPGPGLVVPHPLETFVVPAAVRTPGPAAVSAAGRDPVPGAASPAGSTPAG